MDTIPLHMSVYLDSRYVEFMSPSVQPIPLGKDFLSGQWSKMLLVGCLHCVLGEAFANCEQMKQIEKVLDFLSPTKTPSLEHLLYHLCVFYHIHCLVSVHGVLT